MSTTNPPPRIAKLPRDARGYHVPWFVTWLNGVPDFRVIDARKLPRAVFDRLCWVCGEGLGRYLAFTIGPMCAVNRVSAEPPSHRECAEYSAKTCPFLSNPKAVRRDSQLPTDVKDLPGHALRRNPGVTLIWVTKGYTVLRQPDGMLFRLDDPVDTVWYCEGRPATRQEVAASLATRMPALQAIALRDGMDAMATLEAQYQAAMAHIPQ